MAVPAGGPGAARRAWLRRVGRTSVPGHDGDPAKFVEALRASYAACYSTDADGSVRLPFDLGTGELDRDVWERWRAWDPLHMVPRHADALRNCAAIWIDAGRSDEYYLDMGAEAIRAALEWVGLGEPTVRFELFEARHGGVGWRFPLALRWLAERLAGPE